MSTRTFKNTEDGRLVEINEDGIEIWDGMVAAHAVKNDKELKEVLESRKHDQLHHYWCGSLEGYDGNLDTIADIIESGKQPYWFEEYGEIVGAFVYEWVIK